MSPIQCGMVSIRTLTHLALVFGLLATGTLFLAIATDFWLYTTEILDPGIIPETGDSAAASVAVSAAFGHGSNDTRSIPMPPPPLPPPLGGSAKGTGGEAGVGGDFTPPLIAKFHSGLWRSCAFDDSESEEETNLYPRCTNIVYFGQDTERPETADTTNSILRAIRKSSPVIVSSLVIMTTALGLSMLGNGNRDSDIRSLLAAVLYISSALSLAIGVIFYISAVNDEVSHRKKSMTSSSSSLEVEGFSYRYGWAFYFIAISFIASMVASVNNISLYLRRMPRRRRVDAVKDSTCQQPQLPSLLDQQLQPNQLQQHADNHRLMPEVIQSMSDVRHSKITTPV